MIQAIGAGIAEFDTKIPGRQSLIGLFVKLRMRFGDHVFSQALVGKEGWLEYTGGNNLDFFQNIQTMPAGRVENIQSNLQILYDKLQERHILLVVVIAPNKATIYPDKLPNEIRKIGSQSELDILINYTSKHGPPVLIDLRPALLEAREQNDVYYKTDTHWNSYGSFVAYKEIVKLLSQTYPELVPYQLDDYKLKPIGSTYRDIAGLMGATYIVEPRFFLIPKKSETKWLFFNDDNIPTRVSYSSDKKLPKFLMYMDSFGSPLIPMLAPHFSEATFIHSSSKYPDLLKFEQIDLFKPDIVILEFVERGQNNLAGFLENFGLESEK
jgi:alginate O-acetyltransferase complex protein AlgJ